MLSIIFGPRLMEGYRLEEGERLGGGECGMDMELSGQVKAPL